MIEYSYKGFKFCYKIEQHKNNSKLFGSYGFIVNPEDTQERVLAKFHTDYNTETGVQTEIKKLMEDYIDFEWHQFREITG